MPQEADLERPLKRESEATAHCFTGLDSGTRKTLFQLSRTDKLAGFVTSLPAGCSKDGSEISLFPDNSVTEGAFRKGNSTSQALFDIICDLKELELEHRIKLHVIHVSGKRMIGQ